MAAPTKTPWSSIQRTASQTRWQSVTLQSNTVTSKVTYRTNSFVELGAGLNITNAQGQFVSANPSFTITPTGAAATGAVHQVIVPGDIGSGEGVRVIMPGGEELVFQPLAIDYFDPVDGQGVLLDAVTNAVGWLVASNEIVFSNCFTHIKASIRLRNTRAGLESDLILHESPPEPSAFGLSSSARLEMLTEQLAGPVPTQRTSVLAQERDPVIAAAMLEPDLVDTELTYGHMKMTAGRAFITPATTNVHPAARSGRVAKSFLDFENRKIVIEAVEHRRVRPALLLLPPTTNATPQASLSPLMKAERLAKNTRRLPAWPVSGETREAALQNKKPQPVQQPQHARLAPPLDATVQLASAAAPSPSFVLDYYLVSIYGENDFTFRGDTTYWVSSPVGLTGTTTFEGGTVIKLSEATGLYFTEEDAVVCDTTNHLPAVFTSYDDNSVGEDLGGSGSPTQISTWGLYFMSGSRKLENVRFTYLSNPLAMEGNGSANDLTLRNVQVRQSDYVVDAGGTDMAIYNGLFVNCGMVFLGGDTFLGEHLTVHDATVIGSSANTATVRNSLLVEVDNEPTDIGTYTKPDTTTLSSASGVFTELEGGKHYLAANSIHRNAGTTSIDGQLLNSLSDHTTYAPEEITGTLSTDRTLLPRAIRDTNAPDRGYHYPAVDYLVKNLTVQNATLKMQNGVVVAGGFNSALLWSPALHLNPGKLISQGTATRPNRLLRASQVQEDVQQRGYILLQDGQQQSGFYPELTLRYTELSSLASEPHLLAVSQDARRVELSHSAFVNGQYVTLTLYGGNPQIVGVTNNLFRRVEFGVIGNSPANFFAYNNLFKDGPSGFTGGNSAWRINDNVFDKGAVTDDANSSVVPDKNAYIAGVGPLSFDANPVNLTSLTYASGPFGKYYISGTALENAGSRTAGNAGLYHFTTRTGLTTKEQNTQVDIGLHYPSLTSSSLPYDADADGLADYLEDSNGNGTVETADLASFNKWDTDEDGLPDGLEAEMGTSPNTTECPRAIYEAVVDGQIASQSPSAWFKLNHESGNGFANSKTGSGLTAVGGFWDVDAFASGNGAYGFTSTVNSERLTAGDVISGGDGASKGSISLLFRSLTGVTTTGKRYLFCQKGTTAQEFGVYFEDHVSPGGLKLQVGGQIVTIQASPIAFGTWHYLAITWDENRPNANGPEVTWYLGPVGGTLTSGSINLPADSEVVGNSSTVFIGNRQNNDTTFSSGFRNPGSGALDQIAFWSREMNYVDDILPQFNTLNALSQGPSKISGLNLTRWELTLPVDKANNLDNTQEPLDISTAGLNAGFKYVDRNTCARKYFYRDGNTMVFEVPYNGADQDPNSPATSLGSPRSELRGTLANGNEDNWQPVGTHILEGTCTVNANNLGSGKVIIGQIHGKTPYSFAHVVVNYNYPNAQDVSVTVKDRADGTDNTAHLPGQSDRNITLATGVALGATIKYKIELIGTTGSSLVLYATYNDGTPIPVLIYENGDPVWNDSTWLTSYFYFKAGCYFPKAPANSSAKVTFSSLSASHQP